MAEYQAPITVVRAQPDLTLYNASLHEFVVRHKSNMWALRSIYNDAAPIHRYLPPELLLEVFANLRHDGTRYGPPALRVCHYWHVLLRRTPQLWQTLLNREFQVRQSSPWKAQQFAVALPRSAPLELSIRLRSIDHAVVDVLAPYSRRITSISFLTMGYSNELKPLDRLLQLDMPMLRCLDLRRWPYSSSAGYSGTSSSHVFLFPHLQSLRLGSIILGPPETPHTSLRNLELIHCWESFIVTSSSHVSMSLRTLLTILRSCPNLETLRVEGKLLRDTQQGLESAVNVSRMRHLFLRLNSTELTRALLSYLVLPSTTALYLEHDQVRAGETLPISTR